MILLVDNYDSFTYNLAQYLGTFTEVKVLRNDDENLYEEAEKADGLVFSPGPGWPADSWRPPPEWPPGCRSGRFPPVSASLNRACNS